MIKKYIKKWLIVFSIILGTIGIILACGGGDPDPDQSNFTPETFVDSKFSALFYSTNQAFYNSGLFEPEGYNSRFNETILKEWKVYLKNNVSDEDIYDLFFGNAGATEIDSLYAFYTNGTRNRMVDYWARRLNLSNPVVKNFIEFLSYAKKVEASSVFKCESSWSYETCLPSSDLQPEFIQELKQKFENTNDPFLKNRYWFQTVKAYFYSTQKEETTAYFEETKQKVPHNLLYYRAMCYAAGVYHKAHRFSEANYLYSLVFSECDELKCDAIFGFHPYEEDDWQASLELAKTTEEKTALWAMFGYYTDEARAIQEIYAIAPGSPYLDFLLSRLINKEENRMYNEMTYTSQPMVTWEDYKNRLAEIRNWEVTELVDSIAKSGNTKSQHLWFMASGYLQIFNANYKEAERLFNKVEQTVKLSSLAQKQIRLLRFMNTLSSLDSIGPREEVILYPDLKWLYEECPKADSGGLNVFRHYTAENWSKICISYLYRVKDNKIMRELFNRTDEIYQDDSDIMAMRKFLTKTNKTPFEILAAKLYYLSVDDIDEFRAIHLGYENRMDEAIKILEKLPSDYNPEFQGDPFLGNIQDCHDCDHNACQKTKYSRLTFLHKIKELEENIKHKDHVFDNALLCGNAFYNMSEYGNGRVYYQGDIVGGYFYDASYIPQPFKKLLLGTTVAKSYYQLALKNAATNEQRAKCWFMLAKCERNDFYNTTQYFETNSENNNPEGKDFLAWEGFKMLREKYSKTKYYREAIAECGYFSTYVKQSRRKK